MKRVFMKVLAALVIVVLFSTAALFYLYRDRSLSRLQRGDIIRIGYAAIEAPYAFLKPGDEVTGESPAVAKRVEALSSPTIHWLALREQLGKAEMAPLREQTESPRVRGRPGFGAFASRQADRRLQSAWNAAQKTFIGSPEHLKLITPFGFTEAELPGAITTQEVL